MNNMQVSIMPVVGFRPAAIGCFHYGSSSWCFMTARKIPRCILFGIYMYVCTLFKASCPHESYELTNQLINYIYMCAFHHLITHFHVQFYSLIAFSLDQSIFFLSLALLFRGINLINSSSFQKMKSGSQCLSRDSSPLYFATLQQSRH